MKNDANPAYALRDNQGVVTTDLLDRVLKNGERVLASQGIDLGTVGMKQQASTDWESIDTISHVLRNGIMKAAVEINGAWDSLQDAEFPNKEEVQLLVKTTNEDLEVFADKINIIGKRHEGKKGLIEDGPELSLSLGVSSDYIMLGEELKTLTFPTVLALTEAVDQAISNPANHVQQEKAEA